MDKNFLVLFEHLDYDSYIELTLGHLEYLTQG
jgi:hypothetical protein